MQNLRMVREIACLMAVAMMISGCGTSSINNTAGETTKAPAGTKPVVQEETKDAPRRGESISQTGKGAKIRTDYSGYRKGGQRSEKYGRKSMETLENLRSGKYKEMYPFPGHALYYSGEDGYSGLLGYQWGMVDGKGTILADPTYTTIHRASRYLGAGKGYAYYPFWLLGRAETEKNNDLVEEEWGHWVYAVATEDGSQVTECKYRTVNCWDLGILLAESYESREFILMDPQGKVILDGSHLEFRDRMEDYSVAGMEYGDGLFTIHLQDGEYYMNMEGELVLGPFDYVTPFRQGKAVVTLNNYQDCEIIDTDGHVIVKPGVYEGIDFYNEEGVAHAWRGTDGDSRHYLLDSQGNVLMQEKLNYLTASGSFYVGQDASEQLHVYDHRGKEVKVLDSGWFDIFGAAMVAKQTEDTTYVENLETGTTLELEGGTDQVSVYGIAYSDSVDFETRGDYLQVNHISDDNYSSDLYRSSDMALISDDLLYANCWVDPVTGKDWILCKKNRGGLELRDAEGNLKGVYRGEVSVFNDRILNVDDHYSRYLNQDGNVLFCYSMLSVLDD